MSGIFPFVFGILFSGAMHSGRTDCRENGFFHRSGRAQEKKNYNWGWVLYSFESDAPETSALVVLCVQIITRVHERETERVCVCVENRQSRMNAWERIDWTRLCSKYLNKAIETTATTTITLEMFFFVFSLPLVRSVVLSRLIIFFVTYQRTNWKNTRLLWIIIIIKMFFLCLSNRWWYEKCVCPILSNKWHECS